MNIYLFVLQKTQLLRPKLVQAETKVSCHTAYLWKVYIVHVGSKDVRQVHTGWVKNKLSEDVLV